MINVKVGNTIDLKINRQVLNKFRKYSTNSNNEVLGYLGGTYTAVGNILKSLHIKRLYLPDSYIEQTPLSVEISANEEYKIICRASSDNNIIIGSIHSHVYNIGEKLPNKKFSTEISEEDVISNRNSCELVSGIFSIVKNDNSILKTRWFWYFSSVGYKVKIV